MEIPSSVNSAIVMSNSDVTKLSDGVCVRENVDAEIETEVIPTEHSQFLAYLILRTSGGGDLGVGVLVADPGTGPRGPCPPPGQVKYSHKKMAQCGGLYFMFLDPPLGNVWIRYWAYSMVRW